MSNVAIGTRLGVHSGTIGRRLATMESDRPAREPLIADPLFADPPTPGDVASEEPTDVDVDVDVDESLSSPTPVSLPRRLEDVTVSSRYAGAMLLYPFLSRLGTDQILSSLPSGAARRFNAPSLVLASTFSFALGTSSLEGTKHLMLSDAGALIGTDAFPHLRTLRTRSRSRRPLPK